MSRIGYGYGSEWHLLRWLGYHRTELNVEVERAIKGTLLDASSATGKIEWLDLAWNGKSYHLHLDVEWEGVKFVAHSALSKGTKATVEQTWKDFWPSSGTAQCWDAVGLRESDDGPEWLLVEAKAHMLELKGKCGAGTKSLVKIKRAFVQTQQALGIFSATDAVANDKLMSDWLGTSYQYANRLAALYFFNVYLPQQHHVTMPARLINIYFLKECQQGWKSRDTEQEWSADIDNVYTQLGLVEQGKTMRRLPQKPTLLSYVHELYLPVFKP